MMNRRQHRIYVLAHLLFLIFAGLFFMVAIPALIDYLGVAR